MSHAPDNAPNSSAAASQQNTADSYHPPPQPAHSPEEGYLAGIPGCVEWELAVEGGDVEAELVGWGVALKVEGGEFSGEADGFRESLG